MAGSAPHIPDDDIEAAAQQPAQDENAPAKGDERSLSDKAESIPKLPEDHMEAMAQQALPAENAPADGDRSSHSNELPKLTYEQLLYEYNVGTRNVDLANVFLEFRNLSRMTIIHLMNELAKYEQRIIFKGTANLQDIEHLEDLMHRYTTAVQDRAFWSKLPKYNRFIFKRTLHQKLPGIYSNLYYPEAVILDESSKSQSGPIDPLRYFLNRVLPKSLTWSDEEFRRRGYDEFREGRTPKDISPFVDTLARFIVAITGGLSLVIPMLVMRLGETLAKSLTTVSVAVVLFSALTSLMFKASNVETLGATAAYAAVLVVFVGTSG